MSDVEEPAAKMCKLQETVEGEEIDNGQEEWLSEEILTDEDYNPAADQDQSDSNANTSQEEGNTDSMDRASQNTSNTPGENIERTLNNLENETPRVQAELPAELGAFLIRKTNTQETVDEQPIKEPESELDESIKQSEDDGNDTDDLLRMLGDDGKKRDAAASPSTRPQDTHHTSDEDDDEYIFEGARVTRLKVSEDVVRNNENNPKTLRVAKGAFIKNLTPSRATPGDTSDRETDNLSSKVSVVSNIKAVKLDSTDFVVRSRKVVSKAVSEDLSDFDEDSVPSSDEATTVKKMFDMGQTQVVTSGLRGLAPRRRGINAVKTVTKRVISIDPKSGPSVTSVATPKPPAKLPSTPMMYQKTSKGPASKDTLAVLQKKPGRDDTEEDHLNDDLHDMESDEDEEGGQRMMRPERMDEEVPSDADSHSDEPSYYDEMPSSESEDADDWFTLDIRGERASDYIPMLGEDAKALLTAEKNRAAARLGALQRSANALVAGRRSLATQLRVARSSLVQLDAALAQ